MNGPFFVERHLPQGSILLDAWGQNAYLVKGIMSGIEECVAMSPPCSIDTVLLPFKGVIIGYGYVSTRMVSLGPVLERGISEACEHICMFSHGIITKL